jgi:hypothetical protein
MFGNTICVKYFNSDVVLCEDKSCYTTGFMSHPLGISILNGLYM